METSDDTSVSERIALDRKRVSDDWYEGENPCFDLVVVAQVPEEAQMAGGRSVPDVETDVEVDLGGLDPKESVLTQAPLNLGTYYTCNDGRLHV